MAEPDRPLAKGRGSQVDPPNRFGGTYHEIDFEQLDRLIGELVHGQAAPAAPPEQVRPIEVIRLPQTDGQRVARRRAVEEGERALAGGEVGVIVVAGGSGTRLGYEGPKDLV